MAAQKFPKYCSCGRSYDRLSWSKLPLVGIQAPEELKDKEGVVHAIIHLEYRNCKCGSTITIRLDQHKSIRKIK